MQIATFSIDLPANFSNKPFGLKVLFFKIILLPRLTNLINFHYWRNIDFLIQIERTLN